MSGIFSDPASMTKDKLKKELSLHNVTLPSPSARKDVYVKLYQDQIIRKQRSEFSSDDEEGLGTPRRNKKKPGSIQKSSKPAATPADMDVYSLTDKELSDMLKKFGQNPGPIMATTRRVYQKKLEKLLKEGPAEPAPTINGPDQEEEEEEEEEEENMNDTEKFSDEEEEDIAPVIPVRGNRRLLESQAERTDSSTRRRTTRDVTDRPPLVSTSRTTSSGSRKPYSASQDTMLLSDSSQDTRKFTSSLESRSTTRTYSGTSSTTSQDSLPTRSRPVPKPVISQEKPSTKPAAPDNKKAKGGLSVIAQLFIFLLVVLLIFVVIQNMDPASGNKPRIDTEI